MKKIKVMNLISIILGIYIMTGCSVIEQIAEYNLEQGEVASKEEDTIIGVPESTYTKNDIELAMENPNSFNPLDEIPYSVDQILKLVYEPLFTINQEFEPVYQLAESYERRQDKLYRISLRNDVSFHDGSVLTTEDVLFSFQYLQEIENSPYSYVAEYIESMNIISETEIDVKYKEVNWFNQYSLTFPIISKAYVESENYQAMEPVGTGPYQMNAFQEMLELSLTYNTSYYESNDFFDNIIVTIVRSDLDVYNMFLSKRIDIYYPEETLWNEFAEENSLMINRYMSPNYYYIGMNHHQYFLKDIKARRHLASLIPYETIAKTVFLGHVEETSLPILPQIKVIQEGNPFYLKNTQESLYGQFLTENAPLETYIDWRGEDELDELDVEIPYVTGGGADIRLEGIYNQDDPIQVQIIKVIENSSSPIHLKVDWKAYDKASYLEKLDLAEFDVYLGAYKVPFVPNIDELIGSQGKYNYGDFKSLNINGLLGTYLSMGNEEQMQDQLENLAKVIIEELPYIPLGFLENGVFIHDQVSGILYPTFFNIYHGIYNINPLDQ